MSTTRTRRRASHTRCVRRSLVELTATAIRAVDDGQFVLSSGTAGSNPRSEHTGDKTSDRTILPRQATAPTPVAVLESRYAAPPRKDELLNSDTTTEMTVKIPKDCQSRAFENKANLNAASDHAKDLVETRVGGEAASNDIGGCSLESNFLSVIIEAATELRAHAVESIVQKEPAESAGQPQPRYMRRLSDEAVRCAAGHRPHIEGRSRSLP